MTPRYAVWQNAQQLPLFLQGERPQRKPWLAFLWLAFWLVWFGSWLVWLGSWLAFWLVWFGSWLAWFSFWLASGLVWLLARFLATWLAFWLVCSWLAFWLVWFGSWLAFWLVWLWLFFSLFFLAGHFASISRGHYFAASRLHAAFWTSNPSQDEVKCWDECWEPLR